MAHQHQNRYIADLRDFQFLLFEQFNIEKLLGHPAAHFEGLDGESVRMILGEVYSFVREVLGPLDGLGDEVGCVVENGTVRTPPGFKEAWNKLYQAGWKTIRTSPEYGGQGAPYSLWVLVDEMISGANTAFNMYPGLAMGAAEVIQHFGSPEQKELYLRRMYHGQWGGTMCLTEPHAGSDVGAAKTRATLRPDGTYSITGTKIFISSGDHDMAENIVHLVLARIDGGPPGTKGLSLFIVPKRRIDAKTGESLGSNDVALASIEHKMGINANATCVLNFGENGECVGELVGGAGHEHQGIRQMFVLMNGARISVGIQGVAIASSAYLNALRYCKDRKQGPSIRHFKDASAPRVPIIEHADVRRMLLDMKAHVEGIRALIVKLAYHEDHAELLAGKDDKAHAYHHGQVELLTPLVKAFSSDSAFRVCETAIQCMGGAGFIRDYGIDQYLRDSKIFSIYEGTNHIQAMDLVGRKLAMAGGANLQSFGADVQGFVQAHKQHPVLGAAVETLGKAVEATTSVTMRLMGWFQMGQMEKVPLVANRFLRMMSLTTVGWLLLEQAAIALGKLAELPAEHPDRSFYEGKRYAAVYFAQNHLAEVQGIAKVLAAEDRSALDIPEAAFATV